MKAKIILTDAEPSSVNPDSKELANTIINRIGLMPRKKGATENMYRTLLLLYERTKQANQEKKPELGVVLVEEMGASAGISRQTMYDYLGRWMQLNLIVKTSYIVEGKVVIGYKLNGNTLEGAFEKSMVQIKNNMNRTLQYIRELQKTIKNEKLRKVMKAKDSNKD